MKRAFKRWPYQAALAVALLLCVSSGFAVARYQGNFWNVLVKGALDFGPSGAIGGSLGSITFTNGESIDNATNSTLTFGRNDAGTVTLTAKDDNAVAALTVLPGGAAAMTLGGASTTSITMTTDGMGTAEVAMPAGAVDGTEILDDTITAADLNFNYVGSVTTSALTGLTGGAAAAENVAITLGLDYSATLAADPALAASRCAMASTGLICEGLTADGFETLLTVADPSADRTFTFPNATGTVATLENAQTFTAALTTNSSMTFTTLAGDNVIFTDTTGRVQIPDAGTLVFANASAAAALTLDGATGNGTIRGTVTSTGNTFTGAGALTVLPGGAAAMTLGSGTTTSITLSTDGTGTGEVVMPTGSVDATEIVDLSFDGAAIPMRSWVDCDGATYADLTFCTSGVDALPDFLCGGAAGAAPGLVIEFDATAGSVDANSEICSDFAVDGTRYVSGGALAVTVNKSAETVANTEVLNCAWSVNGAALGATGTVTITGAAGQEVTCTPGGALSAGASVHAVLWITSGGTMDDAVRVLKVVPRYTYSQ